MARECRIDVGAVAGILNRQRAGVETSSASTRGSHGHAAGQGSPWRDEAHTQYIDCAKARTRAGAVDAQLLGTGAGGRVLYSERRCGTRTADAEVTHINLGSIWRGIAHRQH